MSKLKTKKEITAELTKLGIAFDPKAKVEVLKKLLPKNPSRCSSEDRLVSGSEETPEKIKPDLAEPKKEVKNSWLDFEAPDKNGKKIKVYQGKAAIMREALMAQDEVATFIPCDPNESKTVKQIVTLNGYKLEIPKNTYVSLPKQVHDVIRNALEQTEKAFSDMNARFGLDRDEKSIGALH